MNTKINQLLEYALKNGMIEEYDFDYSANLLIDLFGIYEFKREEVEDCSIYEILDFMLDYAVEKGMIQDTVTEKDLLDTRIMNCVMPRPSEVVNTFKSLYSLNPKDATDYFYKLSIDSNYIRKSRIDKNISFAHFCKYGDIQITINLSKPEKDPKEIAKAKNAVSTSYPACLLCKENVGFAGNLNHPARQTHRIIPLDLNGHTYNLQYSPYVYYNEHCIVFNGQHIPMKIEKATFQKLFSFVGQFPHYFLGSNADLPIVGGSILTHDHFQGGRYTFAMTKAPVETKITFAGYEDVEAGIVKWPMSVIRLDGEDPDKIIELADKILGAWRGYTDEDAYIFAETDGEPHNTITPIARMRDGKYEMDLVLRNNITTEEHPLGLYHPWEQYHNIKKENIGLIEVMGLAVLPARLKGEMEELAEVLVAGGDIKAHENIAKHYDWVQTFIGKYDITADNVHKILQDEIGDVFAKILECAGVYKRDEAGKAAFLKFVDYVNAQ